MTARNVSVFLMRHQGMIKRSSLTADGMVITFYPFVEPTVVARMLADLVNLVQPRGAVLTVPDTIRLEF